MKTRLLCTNGNTAFKDSVIKVEIECLDKKEYGRTFKAIGIICDHAKNIGQTELL